MLEKMSEFFEARLDGYDAHMMTNIESAEEFYPFTASLLPPGHILDLGCGTGLELNWYFRLHPDAKVTGIDFVLDGHSHTVMTAGQNGHDDQPDAVGFADDDLFGLLLNGVGESLDIHRKRSFLMEYNMGKI